MMRIIDRYLLGQFVQVFFICLLSFAGLAIVVDAFANLDEFQGYANAKGSLLGSIAMFYGCRSLVFFNLMSGALALISAMFTVTWIQRHHELTALSAAGIPTSRIILPIILAAASISVLAAANRELVIPRIRDHLTRDAKDLTGDAAQDVQPRYDNATDILLRGQKSFGREKRIQEPHFMLPAGLDRQGKHLIAENAYYRASESQRPGGYLLTGVSQPDGLCGGASLALDGRPVVLTARDYPWLEADQVFVVTNVTFEMLAGGSVWRDFSSTAELIRGLASPSLDFGPDVRVAVHSRLVQPLLDVTLLLLGLPLVLWRNNRNVFLAIGLCGGIWGLFMAVVIGCRYLGASYLLTPALAAWLPLFIFVPLAVGMSDPLRE